MLGKLCTIEDGLQDEFSRHVRKNITIKSNVQTIPQIWRDLTRICKFLSKMISLDNMIEQNWSTANIFTVTFDMHTDVYEKTNICKMMYYNFTSVIVCHSSRYTGVKCHEVFLRFCKHSRCLSISVGLVSEHEGVCDAISNISTVSDKRSKCWQAHIAMLLVNKPSWLSHLQALSGQIM